jgi:hypothetical protein
MARFRDAIDTNRRRVTKHMKSIRTCDYKDRLLRTLLVIEGTTMLMQDSLDVDCEIAAEAIASSPDLMVKILRRLTIFVGFISEIYAVTGKCGNPHEDWLNRIDELQQLLHEHNIIDIDKAVEKTKCVCHLDLSTILDKEQKAC